VAGSCEHGNKPSGSIKGRGFLDKLRNYQLLESPLLHGTSYIVRALMNP
jgi:hypothetical protein